MICVDMHGPNPVFQGDCPAAAEKQTLTREEKESI